MHRGQCRLPSSGEQAPCPPSKDRSHVQKGGSVGSLPVSSCDSSQGWDPRKPLSWWNLEQQHRSAGHLTSPLGKVLSRPLRASGSLVESGQVGVTASLLQTGKLRLRQGVWFARDLAARKQSGVESQALQDRVRLVFQPARLCMSWKGKLKEKNLLSYSSCQK